MKSVNVHEAKTNLSRLLREVEAGREIVIARSGRAVARLVPASSSTPRVLGRERGQIWMADDFNEPMPDDWLADWNR